MTKEQTYKLVAASAAVASVLTVVNYLHGVSCPVSVPTHAKAMKADHG